MSSDFQYRLSDRKKHEISSNLIEVLRDLKPLSAEAGVFVSNWCLTGPDEKVKAFFDVWNEVLLNYKPTEFPILFRSYKRFVPNKIVSFTGNIDVAYRFARDNLRSLTKGRLAICDTRDYRLFLEDEKEGSYVHSFYPLGKLLLQELNLDKSVLNYNFLIRYSREDEYILRFTEVTTFFTKWVKN